MKKLILIFAITMSCTTISTAQQNGKTFRLSDEVTVEKVSYPNRYGIAVAADMYVSKALDKSKKHPALIVGTPYGGVKEQGAGIYAQIMAERGFVVIAFDELPSSGGKTLKTGVRS